jgi:hypothetical protein
VRNYPSTVDPVGDLGTDEPPPRSVRPFNVGLIKPGIYLVEHSSRSRLGLPVQNTRRGYPLPPSLGLRTRIWPNRPIAIGS